eukprot:896239-Rhodomonas_salina.2
MVGAVSAVRMFPTRTYPPREFAYLWQTWKVAAVYAPVAAPNLNLALFPNRSAVAESAWSNPGMASASQDPSAVHTNFKLSWVVSPYPTTASSDGAPRYTCNGPAHDARGEVKFKCSAGR